MVEKIMNVIEKVQKMEMKTHNICGCFMRVAILMV